MCYFTRNLCIALVLGLLVGSSRALAEPLYPLLSTGAVDSLRTRLAQSREDTTQVQRLLRLGEDFLNKREIAVAHLDSAQTYLVQAQRLSNALQFTAGQIRSGFLLGLLTARKGDTRRGASSIERALSASQKSRLALLEAEGWYYLGEAYEESTEGLPEKIRCYGQSRQRYRQLGNREQEAYVLKCIADMHHQQGKSAQAVRELLETLALYRSAGYPKLHYTHDLLVAVNRHLGNYREAIGHGLSSIESARATGDTAYIGLFYGRLGVIHEELNQWEEGMVYHRKAMAHFWQENNRYMILRTARDIATNLLRQGKAQQALAYHQQVVKEWPPNDEVTELEAISARAECYLALRQYPGAEKHYRRMLVIERNIKVNVTRKVNTYQRVGNFYLIKKRYDDARTYLDTALFLNARGGTLKEAMNIHLLLFKLDSAQGHYKEAIVHHQRYKALNDSIFNETKSKQTASLLVRYQMKEKEHNIALLTKQNQVQQAHLRQRDLQRNSLMAGALMLVFLSGVIYNRYRLKRHSNQLLLLQKRQIHEKNQTLEGLLLEKEHLLSHKDTLLEEKEWLLKEVHHRVKNNLQIVMSLLSSQAAYLEDDKVLSAIKESQQRVYAISLIHENLYQSENVSLISMDAYVKEVVEYLLDSFQVQGQIGFHREVAAIDLDIAIAVSLGLIINEAVTNSLKYAFPNRRKGSVRVSLQPVDNGNYLLKVADDGIGPGPDFDPTHTRSLGMNLMKGLTKQVGGSMTIETTNGLTVSVLFNGGTKGVKVVKHGLG
jgi:two-component sensor histidine kinase